MVHRSLDALVRGFAASTGRRSALRSLFAAPLAALGVPSLAADAEERRVDEVRASAKAKGKKRKGKRGPQGPPGPPGPPGTLTLSEEEGVATLNDGNGGQESTIAACPSGTQVISCSYSCTDPRTIVSELNLGRLTNECRGTFLRGAGVTIQVQCVLQATCAA